MDRSHTAVWAVDVLERLGVRAVDSGGGEGRHARIRHSLVLAGPVAVGFGPVERSALGAISRSRAISIPSYFSNHLERRPNLPTANPTASSTASTKAPSAHLDDDVGESATPDACCASAPSVCEGAASDGPAPSEVDEAATVVNDVDGVAIPAVTVGLIELAALLAVLPFGDDDCVVGEVVGAGVRDAVGDGDRVGVGVALLEGVGGEVGVDFTRQDSPLLMTPFGQIVKVQVVLASSIAPVTRAPVRLALVRSAPHKVAYARLAPRAFASLR